MYLKEFPYYCGGRLLIGLHYGTRHLYGKTELDIIQIHCDVRSKAYNDWYKVNTDPTQNVYCPGTLKGFQQTLRYMLGMDRASGLKETWGVFNIPLPIGTLFAVTNEAQEDTAKNLLSCGFKQVGLTSKYGGKDTVYKPNCKSWIGDVHNDVVPILSKVRPYSPPPTSENIKGLFSKRI